MTQPLIPTTASDHKTQLVENIMPFWNEYAFDSTYGGIYAGLARAGDVIESDKSVWFQGRAAWVYSHIAIGAAQEHDQEQLRTAIDAAKSVLCFLEDYCQDTADQRFFFRVTEDGKPLVKRRYLFSECFACLGHAAYSRALRTLPGSIDTADFHLTRARELHDLILRFMGSDDSLTPKFSPETRPSIGLGLPMILINVLQELRMADPSGAEQYSYEIDGHISTIERLLDSDRRCLLEQADPSGCFLNHLEGRQLNPGHAMEAAWFLFEEATTRNRDDYAELAYTILDWMWEWGWDKEYGGILYYRDANGYDSHEYWHDMKFWWPQCEALIANLYAWKLCGKDTYFRRYMQTLEWTYGHFPDSEHGEWFGYLHRDGTPSSTLKGTIFKGPFHIPRMHIICSRLLA